MKHPEDDSWLRGKGRPGTFKVMGDLTLDEVKALLTHYEAEDPEVWGDFWELPITNLRHTVACRTQHKMLEARA